MKIEYYSTNIGNIFRVVNAGYYGSNRLTQAGLCSINGVEAPSIKELSNNWYLFKGELKDFVKTVQPKNTLVGYNLIQKELESKHLPLSIPLAEVSRDWDEDDGYSVTYNNIDITKLYSESYMASEATTEPLEVELVKLRELVIENYEEPAKMQVLSQEGNFGGKSIELDLSSIVQYEDFESFLTPEFMLHTRPCSLSSQQVYKIVRAYVLKNINNKYARVTSNYDFCFEVKKVVDVPAFSVKEEKLTSRGNSYKPPRFESRKEDSRQVPLFRMTWDKADNGSGWKDYPVIEGWEASNLIKMQHQVKNYLEDLIEVINSPAKECLHCKGHGMILDVINIERNDSND